MDLQPVHDAYSFMSEEYIGLFDGAWQEHEDDTGLIRRHLTGLSGPVLDLGCGPGQWTAYLYSLGADVTGIDMVPEFIAHAQAPHPGPEFQLGSMTELDAPRPLSSRHPQLVLDDPPAAIGTCSRAHRVPPAPPLLGHAGRRLLRQRR